MTGQSVRMLIVLGIAAVVWIGMTISVAISVVQSPAQNAGLGFGVLLVWVVALAWAALFRWSSRGGDES